MAICAPRVSSLPSHSLVKQLRHRAVTINQGHKLRHQMAAGHTFRIPSSDEDVTPDKLASGNDRLALYLQRQGRDVARRDTGACA